MRYEEALVFQTLLAQQRARRAADRTTGRTPREGGLLTAFDARLPFELTAGQRAVGQTLAEIYGVGPLAHGTSFLSDVAS